MMWTDTVSYWMRNLSCFLHECNTHQHKHRGTKRRGEVRILLWALHLVFLLTAEMINKAEFFSILHPLDHPTPPSNQHVFLQQIPPPDFFSSVPTLCHSNNAQGRPGVCVCVSDIFASLSKCVPACIFVCASSVFDGDDSVCVFTCMQSRPVLRHFHVTRLKTSTC